MEQSIRLRLVFGSAAASISWAALAASPAYAAPVPPPSAAIDQYVEQIPTARGAKAIGAGGESPRPLPPQQRVAIDRVGGADAPLLKAVATSPAYGAPSQRKRPIRREDPRIVNPAAPGKNITSAPQGHRSASSSNATATTLGLDRRDLLTFIAVLAVAALGIASRVKRKRG